jgi:hypothetical protein
MRRMAGARSADDPNSRSSCRSCARQSSKFAGVRGWRMALSIAAGGMPVTAVSAGSSRSSLAVRQLLMARTMAASLSASAAASSRAGGAGFMTSQNKKATAAIPADVKAIVCHGRRRGGALTVGGGMGGTRCAGGFAAGRGRDTAAATRTAPDGFGEAVAGPGTGTAAGAGGGGSGNGWAVGRKSASSSASATASVVRPAAVAAFMRAVSAATAFSSSRAFSLCASASSGRIRAIVRMTDSASASRNCMTRPR